MSIDTESYETLSIEQDGPVLRVWLDRPERRNAVDELVLIELGDLFAELETQFQVRVAVLGGRGPAFCAGFDRKAVSITSGREEPVGARERRWLSQVGRRACRAIEEAEVVTVARVHGYAVGGGLCLALSCDFRVAEKTAFFELPEVELGLPLSWSATPRLVHEIGAARARELILLGSRITAEEGEPWGLVHRAVEPSDLDAAVEEVVAALATRPELAVHMTRTQLRSLARQASSGDISETDGDLVTLARRDPETRRRFGWNGGD
ncbi:MAG: enoyl-CoA hydratase/isomerase family protein [Proteobacteria bacterium]|nr:enoyl-CoA hydratase/isomerase family protein [Pseudomonadota bacterium]